MPVELTIVETTVELGQTNVEVVLESASEPGPQGPQGATGAQGIQGIQGIQGDQGDPGEGVPAGGTTGQVLAKATDTDFDTEWSSVAGGGAPTDADYLVGTANGSLSGEIVVGTSPGGELGGTWASPTVDATHSGSSHAAVQAAAEATAAGELATHAADTTSVHGIADTSALALTANAVMDGDTAGGVLGGTYPNPSFAADMATQAELDALTTIDYLVGTATGSLSAEIVVGTSPGGELGGTWGSPTVDATHSGSSHAAVQAAAEATAAAALSAHESDTTSVHGITDTSTLYRSGGTDVALADGGTGASLADPGADRIMFWDDSAGAITFLTAGTNLTITDTTIAASGGGGGAADPDDETLILHMRSLA